MPAEEFEHRLADDHPALLAVLRAPSEPEPEASDAELEQVVAVIDALALLSKLPPNLRDVLVLYYVEDRTALEIADSLGLPNGRAVYTLIDNALRRLAK